MNQRPAKLKTHMGLNDKGVTLSAYDLVDFLTQAVEAFEKRGDEDVAARFEIMRDYVKEDVIELKKPLSFNAGISLGL